MKLFYRFSKGMVLKIDQIYGTRIEESVAPIYRYILGIWSQIRRILDPLRIRLRYKLRIGTQKDVRLHLGCGFRHFDGYVNVDLWITEATDVICDISSLPWPDNSVSIIESYHVIEHILHEKAKLTCPRCLYHL
mgnify:CR=1 FL=1|jgi:hypothetical protein|tara:strand:+ start:1282 stop:1683 length:402 start_codon:yes stop_codon:yes gene_type:complete